MKLAVHEALIGETTTDALFRRAAFIGVDGVALSGDGLEARVPDLARASLETGIAVAGIHYGRQGAVLSADPVERERALDRLRSNIACAVDLRAAGVTLVPHYGQLAMPDLSPWMSPAQLYAEMLHQHLRTLSDFCHALGTKLFIQPTTARETAFITRLEQAGAVVKRIKHSDIKIAADFVALGEESTDQAAMVDSYAAHIAYTTIPAAYAGAKPLIQAVGRSGYDGWLTFVGESVMSESDLLAAVRLIQGDLSANVL